MLLIMSKYLTRRRNDIRTPKQRMSEDLTKFKNNYRSFSKERLLKWLIKLSREVYIIVPKDLLRKRRKEFNDKIKKNTVVRYNGLVVTCKLCEEDPARHRHHIVQLQYGGNSKAKNLFALCNDCHKLIHSWL